MNIRGYRQLIVFTVMLFATKGPLHAILTTAELTGYDGWTEVHYANQSDYFADQQTGQSEADIVGDASGNQTAIYTNYQNVGNDSDLSNDYIGFRMRVSASSQSSGWDTIGLFGLDISSDGDIDLFVGVLGGNSGGIYMILAAI